MHARSWLPFVAAVTLVVAACGGGDDETATTVGSTAAPTTAPVTTAPATTAPATTAPPTTAAATTTPTTEPATTAPAPTAPPTTLPSDPQAVIALGALITLDDFAEGWTAGPTDDDDADDEEANAIISSCAGVDPALIDDDVLGTTQVKSPTFTTVDENYTVDQSAGFAADEATAVAAAAAVSDPDVPGCYGEAVVAFFERAIASSDPAETLPPGIEIGEVTSTVGDLAPFALAADSASWFHVEYPLTIDGQTFEQHADFVFLQNGAALTRLTLAGFGGPFPLEDVQGIVQLADAKLATIA